MLDIKLLREQPDAVRRSLRDRGMKPELVDGFLELDGKWRALTKEIDEFRAQMNQLSKERKIDDARVVKEKLKAAEAAIKGIETSREDMLYEFPNIPAHGVPVGRSELDNVVLREVGKKTEAKKDYLTLAEELDLIDVKRSGKVAGSRFGYIKRELALLEFALVKLALDTLVPHGFIPVIPPVMIKPDVYRRMGRLAGSDKDERYYLGKDDLYLAGSSEHTIGPMHMDEVFEEQDLPRRYVAFSTCFRREAGSYGKDTKGILRVHQFDKVEMFSFTKPEDSEKEHEFLLSLQEKLMQKLKLPYRVVLLCTADMGFTDAKQYDVEAWIPSEGKYRETHSCSNTTDFQARGINAKYRPTTNNPALPAGRQQPTTQFLHMLNATGIAIGRMLIAILENCQTKKGTVRVPRVLQKYAGFKQIEWKENLDRN